MKDRKRSRAILNLIEDANRELMNIGKDGENSGIFQFMTSYLIGNGFYRGYNFYRRTGEYRNGKEILALAGSATDFDCIQLW